jgi:SpoU rRNA methylase family enzyme
MIVAGNDQNATVACATGGIGVAKDIAATINARPLAVPQAEHAIVLGAGEQADLLAAPDGGRRHVFIDAGLKGDVVLGKMRFGFPQAEVEIAERAAAVAGNEAGGIQPGGEVALALQHRQADQRLGTGQEDAAGCACVFVIQCGSSVSQIAHCCLRLFSLVGIIEHAVAGMLATGALEIGLSPGLGVPAMRENYSGGEVLLGFSGCVPAAR